MWAIQGDSPFPAWFGLVFLAIFSFLVISRARFDKWIAPKAVLLWASENGFVILRLDRIYGWTRFAARRELRPVMRPSSCQVLFWVVVRTSERVASDAWLVVGDSLWPGQSASRCPVRVQWRGSWIEEPKPLPTPKPARSPMWDEAIDQ
jgi:hypothetical protein